MRTTLNIDDELLKEAKIAAIRRGSTLTALIESALRKEVDEIRPRRGGRTKERVNLPAHIDPDDPSAVREFLRFVTGPADHARSLGPFPSRKGEPKRDFDWTDTSALIEEIEGPSARS